MLSSDIQYANDESPVMKYHAANVKKPVKAKAYVILTNKRVIIEYHTYSSTLVTDVNINDVRGTAISWHKARKTRRGVGILIIGAIALLLGLFGGVVPGFPFSPSLFVGIPIIAYGIYVLARVRASFVIIIYAKLVSPSLSLHNLKEDLKISLDASPGPDANKMVNEIGVIIQDIQKALEKEKAIA